MEGDAGAARSMETLLRARLDAQVARDRHRDRLRVIDADIRRAEEEGFAADAKVVSAREDLRRLERARDDARRRYAVLIARRKMANVTTRALAERDAALRTPAAAPEPSPSPTFAEAYPPPPFTSSRRRAGCETPAWNLRRVRASADATRLEGASCRVTSADDPNPGVPKVPKPTTPRRVPPEQLVCAGHGANPPPTTTAAGGCATSLDARAVSAGDAGDGPAKGKRLDRLVKETWRTPTAASAIWRFGRRSSNCHRRQFYLRGCPYQ